MAIGRAKLGMMVAETLRRKRKMTSMTRNTASSSVNLTSLTDCADGNGAVVLDRQVDRRRHDRVEPRNQLADVIDDIDGVRAGLALNRQHDAGNAVDPGRRRTGPHPVADRGDLVEAHRGPIAVSDDQRTVDAGVGELAVGLDVIGLVSAVEGAHRQVDVGALNRLLDFVDADLAAGERLGVQLHAHGVLRGAVDTDLGHARAPSDICSAMRFSAYLSTS